MGLASTLLLFTPYTDSRERAVARFFKGLTERSNQRRVKAALLTLLQRDSAVINLWTEYQYKGYTYLHKSQRKKLYANLQLIVDDFGRFAAQSSRPAHAVTARIHQLAPRAAADPEKAGFIQAIMDYLSPARGLYEYRTSSSFGWLLRDPAHERLIGDCNQIVTLYIYLYSRRYDVRDLQIRTLPEHVALHFSGIDIETTAGTFANYSNQKGNTLLPIEEIVSINLLDATDAGLAQHEITPEALLQESRIAFILSHSHEVVRHNLNAAYHKQINALMERNDFARALKFAIASRNMQLLGIVGHNGAVYEMERHNYAAARRFAQHAPEREKLIHSSWQSEGARHYETEHYSDAIKAFEHSGDMQAVRNCYEQLFFIEQDKLGKNLTTESIKKYSRTIKQMHIYAVKSGNKKLIQYTKDLKQHL